MLYYRTVFAIGLWDGISSNNAQVIYDIEGRDTAVSLCNKFLHSGNARGVYFRAVSHNGTPDIKASANHEEALAEVEEKLSVIVQHTKKFGYNINPNGLIGCGYLTGTVA